MRSRLFQGFVRALGPLVLTLLPYAAWVPVNRWMIAGELPNGPWVWSLLLPGLALEGLASRFLDAPPVGPAALLRARAGLALRWVVMGLYFNLLIARTARMLDTPDNYATLVGFWPEVARFPYIASPVLGALGALGLIWLYWRLTVRRRRWRLTTTLLLPASFTLGLFHLWYSFPDSPLHLLPTGPEAPVERVFPFDGDAPGPSSLAPPVFARDLHVSEDETVVIASYGGTFLRRFLPQPQPNLARIDLVNRRVRFKTGSPIRRFESTCSDRLYVGPWHGSSFEEVDPATLETREIRLPATVNGEKVAEINVVLHDCENHRVFIGNGRNPIVFVWNTRSRSLEKTVNLVGVNGLRMGDTLGPIRKNPRNGRIYIGLHGRWNFVELDVVTLEPVRFAVTPEFPFEGQVSRDGAWIFGTAFLSGTMWRHDAASLELVRPYDIPVHCRRIQPTDDGSAVIVLSFLTGEIVSYDVVTGRELQRFRVGPKAEGLFVTKNYAWVSAATGIFRVPLRALSGGKP